MLPVILNIRNLRIFYHRPERAKHFRRYGKQKLQNELLSKMLPGLRPGQPKWLRCSREIRVSRIKEVSDQVTKFCADCARNDRNDDTDQCDDGNEYNHCVAIVFNDGFHSLSPPFQVPHLTMLTNNTSYLFFVFSQKSDQHFYHYDGKDTYRYNFRCSEDIFF